MKTPKLLLLLLVTANFAVQARRADRTEDVGVPSILIAKSGLALAPNAALDISPASTGVPGFIIFSIKNTGSVGLVLSGPITVSGTDAADFTVTQPTQVYPPGFSASFTVSFQPHPGGADLRNAIVTILSNDPVNGSFDLAITGSALLYGPMYPPIGTFQADFSGDAGRAGGRNIMLTAVSLSTKTPTYWGPQVDAGSNLQLKVSLDGSTYTNQEILTFDPSRTNLANGVSAWTGQTFIQNAINGTTPVVFIRATLTTKRADNSIVPMIDPVSVGLPDQIGGIVPFASLTDYLVANYLIEASLSSNSGFQPYLNFYDAYPTPAGPLPGQGIGNAYSSISDGFYWNNLPPRLTVNQVLQVDEGASATITSTLLNATDDEDMPSSPQSIVFKFENSPPGGNPLNFGTGQLKKNNVALTSSDVFTLKDIMDGKIAFFHSGSETIYDEFQFSFTDSRGAQGVDAGHTLYTFKINIVPVNDLPVTSDVSANVSYVSPSQITLAATDAETPNQLTYSVLTNPLHGSVAPLTNSASPILVYSPTAGQAPGVTDSFTYTANDGTVDGNTSTVTVHFINQLPVLNGGNPGNILTREGVDVTSPITATDPEGQALTLNVTTSPVRGTVVSITGLSLVYRPSPGKFGRDFIRLTATDAQGGVSNEVLYTVDVLPALNEGDILVADQTVIRLIDPATLQDSIVFLDNTSVSLAKAQNLYFRRNTSMFILDQQNGVLKSDPRTGVTTVLAGPGNFVSNPGLMGVELDATGKLLVTDGTNKIMQVDTVSGVVSTRFSAGSLTVATGMVLLNNGDLLVTDAAAFGGGTSKLVRITPVGVQTIVTQGGNLKVPIDVDLVDQNTAIVADGGGLAGGTDRVIRIDLGTGTQTSLSTGGDLGFPSGVGVDHTLGKVFISNQTSQKIVQVDPLSGAQTLIHGNDTYAHPFGLFVIPVTVPVVLPNVYVTAPADGATGTNITVSVAAKSLTGATTYTLQLSPSSTFASGVLEKSGGKTQSFAGLAYGTKYYTRVKTNLSPVFGKITSFTTGPVEQFTFVTAPANNAQNVGLTVTVSSSNVVGATTYTIELNTASDFTGTSIVKSGKKSQSFTGLALATHYYSRVMTDMSPNWGATRNFTTGNAATLSYVTGPGNNAVKVSWLPTVTVNNIGATSYTLQLSPFSDFSGGLVEMTGSTTKFTVTSRLEFNTKYYSRVTSNLAQADCQSQCTADFNNCTAGAFGDPDVLGFCNASNAACQAACTSSAWGPVRSFTTGVPTASYYITAPADNATNVNLTTNVTAMTVAGASSYDIELNTASDFTGTSIVKSTTTRSASFTLTDGQTYYGRVRTDLDLTWGTTIRSFTTGTFTSLAYITSPKNGGVGVPTTVTVTSNMVGTATSYSIELNTASDFTGISIVKTGATKSQKFTGLMNSTIYYARVSTNMAPGLWGPTRSFTTIDLIAPTALISMQGSGRTLADWEGEDQGEDDASKTTELPVQQRIVTYPSPFQQNFTLQMEGDDDEPFLVRITDMNGRQIFVEQLTRNQSRQLGDEWSKGLYLIAASKGDQLLTHKVIKH